MLPQPTTYWVHLFSTDTIHKLVRPSKTVACFIISSCVELSLNLDNNGSFKDNSQNRPAHIKLSVLSFCRENGIVLSLPPHMTHRLMPPDRSILKSLKDSFNHQMGIYRRNETEASGSQSMIILCEAWPESVAPSNIISGFRTTEIWPFNPAIFTEKDFAPSWVADRPLKQCHSASRQRCHLAR